MWFEADTTITIPVDYLVDGEYVVPTSATYVVRAHNGALLDSGSMPAAANSEELTIAAAHNAIAADWENRYVKLEFSDGSKVYHRTVVYKLSSFLPLTATPDNVRALIGVNARELPDSDISLYEAYFTMVELYGAGISAALTETGQRNAAVNEAVAIKAAIQIAESLPLRAMLTVRSEDSSASRAKDIDFDGLVRNLEARLSSLIDTARGTTPVTPVVFDFSTPEDPFTG